MAVLVFVHGTGVREAQYVQTLQTIRSRMASRPEFTVVGCYWGSLVGATLAAGGASVPRYAETGGHPPPSEEDRDVALWTVLYADPFYELRFLSLSRPSSPFAAPGPRELILGVDRYRPSAGTVALFRDAGLEHFLDDAFAVVRDSREIESAAASASPFEFREAVSRAVVACASTASDEQGHSPVDGALRDLLVTALGSELGATGLSLGKPMTRAARDVAFRALSGMANAHRGSLTEGAGILAGDVMRFLTRPAEFTKPLDVLLRTYDDERVFLLGHSLGGIMGAHLLMTGRYDNVAGLITVGSQVPFLYEVGALPSLVPPDPLPAHLPPWLNVYDPRDLLSYVGAAVFGPQVVDVEVDTGQPFPKAHSTYWNTADMWQSIHSFLS